MRFDWSKRSLNQWRDFLHQAPRANWMQSWPYAKATYLRDHNKTRLGVILASNENSQDNLQEQAIGIFAIQEIRLGPIHFIDLYRGPLWFETNPPLARLQEFAKAFNLEFPRSIFTRRRWLPEWEITETANEVLLKEGFKLKKQSFQTIWIDLTQDLETIRNNLKQKWRNGLHKAERNLKEAQIITLTQSDQDSISSFMKNYEKHKNKIKFHGPSPKFILEELKSAMAFKDAIVLTCVCENTEIAGMLIEKHGKSASYRVSWNSENGRSLNAHYFLLWQAIVYLKECNISSFDLGGILPFEAQGVSQFKRGLGGKEVKLLGVFS